MFNSKEFENKVFNLVNKEINQVFSALLEGNKNNVQIQGIILQRQVMESLHAVTEGVATEIFSGLLINLEAKIKHADERENFRYNDFFKKAVRGNGVKALK